MLVVFHLGARQMGWACFQWWSGMERGLLLWGWGCCRISR